MSTSAPLRAAIIGLGRMGSTFDDETGQFSRWRFPHAHAACYRAIDGVELVAGADPHPAQRDAFAQRWGLDSAHVYSDFRAMLERERPDIVSVCTSAGPRARVLLDVVAAGTGIKAIWAEKPLAVSLHEADQMVDACRLAGIYLATGASRSWDAMYNQMRALIDAGQIGDVLHVTGMWSCTLSSNGSHLLTTVAYLAGGPQSRCVSVSGEMESDEKAQGDNDLAGNGTLHFDNGADAYVRSMACGAGNGTYDVIGTQGRLLATHDAEEVQFWRMAKPDLPGRRRAEPVRYSFPPISGTATANARLVQDLLVCIETGKEPNCNGEAGRQALEIAIAMRESHRRGGSRVALPLSDRSLRINSSDALSGDEPAIIRRARAAARAS